MINTLPPNEIRQKISEMDNLRRVDINRLTRDLSFEISCWNFLNNGVVAKYENHASFLRHVYGEGLYLQVADVLLAHSYPCDNVSLDGEFVVEIGRLGQIQWKIDSSLLKKVNFLQLKNDVLINCCHVLQYDTTYELPLRAVLQFKGKNSQIFFDYFFDSSGESEVGVIVEPCDSFNTAITGIRFLHHGKNYLLYSYTDNSNAANYIVIEAIDPVAWQAFTEVSRRILNVLGFLTGHFMFGPFLIFTTSNKSGSELVGYENCLPPPCESIYTMTVMNPYWYFATSDINHVSSDRVNGGLSSVEKLREKLMPFRKRHVEKLMDLLDDKYFSLLFYTLVENSTLQHMRMATSRLIAYATCLEISGNWFKKQADLEGKRVNPDFLPVEIRKELTSILQKEFDNYVRRLGTHDQRGIADNVLDVPNKNEGVHLTDNLQIVRRRIESELFKQTNAAKLSSQFIENGIQLTDSEVKLLDGRNRILHGADSIKVEFKPENPEPYIEVSERKCFEYYALIWRLIMHVIGYEGIYCDVASAQKAFRTRGSNSGKPFIRDV